MLIPNILIMSWHLSSKKAHFTMKITSLKVVRKTSIIFASKVKHLLQEAFAGEKKCFCEEPKEMQPQLGLTCVLGK